MKGDLEKVVGEVAKIDVVQIMKEDAMSAMVKNHGKTCMPGSVL